MDRCLAMLVSDYLVVNKEFHFQPCYASLPYTYDPLSLPIHSSVVVIDRYQWLCANSVFQSNRTPRWKKKATIPFRYIHNFIIVEARIYGIIPLQFIFDTGAEHIILFKREYTDLLQVPYDRRIPVLGSDMSREILH